MNCIPDSNERKSRHWLRSLPPWREPVTPDQNYCFREQFSNLENTVYSRSQHRQLFDSRLFNQDIPPINQILGEPTHLPASQKPSTKSQAPDPPNSQPSVDRVMLHRHLNRFVRRLWMAPQVARLLAQEQEVRCLPRRE